jgi:hypothetical protein
MDEPVAEIVPNSQPLSQDHQNSANWRHFRAFRTGRVDGAFAAAELRIEQLQRSDKVDEIGAVRIPDTCSRTEPSRLFRSDHYNVIVSGRDTIGPSLCETTLAVKVCSAD